MKKVYVEITNACNLSCKFCIKSNKQKRFMKFTEFSMILDKLNGITSYLYFHVLGEPLMHPLINDFIDEARKRSFFVNITTNGFLIDRIKDNKNIRQLNISLHSYNSSYNISLDKYLSNIFNCVDKLVENGTIINYRLWVDSKYSKDIISKLSKYYTKELNLVKMKIKDNIYLDIDTEFIWPDLNNNYYNEVGKCYGGITHFGILVDGTVVPCCLDSKGIINLGNIYKTKINDILNNQRLKNMTDGFKKGKKCEELCKHCAFLD